MLIEKYNQDKVFIEIVPLTLSAPRQMALSHYTQIIKGPFGRIL